MGNLNRGPLHVLVNSVDQTVFGAYTTLEGEKVLVHKPTGISIPGKTSSSDPYNVEVAFGSTVDAVKEIALYSLVAPYPADTHNYEVILNLTRVGRRQGGIDSHRRESKAYSYRIAQLGAVSGTEVNDTDKLNALKGIVMLCNNDPMRSANLGMTYVIENDDYSDASTVKITLQDGTEYTVSTSGGTGTVANSLAYAINNTTGLKDYVKAYGSTKSINDNERIIIENIVPCYFAVEGVTDVSVIEYYLRVEVQEDDYQITVGSGTASGYWEKVPHSRWNIDTVAGTCVNGASDADASITDGTHTLTLNVTVNTNNATKCINLAQLLSKALSGFPTTVYSAALNSATAVDAIVIGAEVTITPAAGTDKIVCTETPVLHQWSRLSIEDMFDVFPILPQDAFINKERPSAADYCKLTITWKMNNHPDVTIMDGILAKEGQVSFYILKSALPATATTTLDYWYNASGNYMSDTLPAAPNVNFFKLLFAWNPDVTASFINAGL